MKIIQHNILISALPYGQLPVYEEDGRILTQSLAIAKYVARGTDLVPTDPWKNAVIESIVFTLIDYFKSKFYLFVNKGFFGYCLSGNFLSISIIHTFPNIALYSLPVRFILQCINPLIFLLVEFKTEDKKELLFHYFSSANFSDLTERFQKIFITVTQ